MQKLYARFITSGNQVYPAQLLWEQRAGKGLVEIGVPAAFKNQTLPAGAICGEIAHKVCKDGIKIIRDRKWAQLRSFRALSSTRKHVEHVKAGLPYSLTYERV